MTGVEIGVLIVGVLGGLSGLAALANAIFGRGKTRAEEAQILTGTALTLMKELEKEAKAASDEADQARTQMQAVRDEARALADELHKLRTAIMRPDATVEGLRLLVTGRLSNGTSH